MQNTPIWKPILILTVVGLWALSLYPPSQRLKPGLDLAGGTTLVYQVQVPAGQDSKTVIEQTISALRKRVDPDGVRNLIWRPQTGSRIEIQIPLPPSATVDLRQAYLDARDQVLVGNISKGSLDVILRADPTQRQAELKRLAGGDEQRSALLRNVTEQYDRYIDARGPYQTIQDQVREATKHLEALLPGEEGREELKTQVETLQEDLIAKTRVFLSARRSLNAARKAVLSSNIDPIELQRIVDLPNKPSKPETPDAQPGPSQREKAFATLRADHPGRVAKISALEHAYNEYDQVKGPLDDPNDLIALLRGSGVLGFRIAAALDLPDAVSYREQLTKRGPKAGTNRAYRWFKIDDPASFVDDFRQLQALEDQPQEYFQSRGLIGQEYAGSYYVLLANVPGQSLTQAQEGWRMTNAYPTIDQDAFRVVGFELNGLGGQLMAELTGNNKGKQMAIVLDGRVISTPSIRSKIQDRGIITGGRGGFSQMELDYLLRTLNAGSLQGRLSPNPIYIRKFGPQLGQDNLQSGLKAAIWALMVVALFMGIYYMFSGIVADFALASNMVLILGSMAIFDATFTLPGIAGIVLTIGMAVDANVLIFERIREEQEREKTDILTAIHAGYGKALATIIDANLTTMITCVVLYYTATAEVKGFALTLMIGILATMFTALFCTRVIIDIYMELTNAKKLSSLPTAIPGLQSILHPKINWVGKRFLFGILSVALIVCGVFSISSRGKQMFDIEFRGGTQVSFSLAEGKTMTIEQVRDRLDQAAKYESKETGLPLNDLAGDSASVVTIGLVQGTAASEFSIATVEQDVQAVSDAIKNTFADVLDAQRPIDFVGMSSDHQASALRSSPVYPIRQGTLGENINRPDIQDPVEDYIGGVVVLLDQMDPAPTLEQLSERVRRMRLQPAFEGMSYRTSKVIGLDLAEGGSIDEQARYSSAVVVTTDAVTNYIENPDTFTDPPGLAATEWQLVHDALRRDTSLDSVSNFSGQVSNTMKQQAIVAMVMSLLAVVVYIWFRFGSIRYGLAAIVALVHDVTIVLGLVALTGWLYDTPLGAALMLGDFKINLAMVAALLTIVGYSLNDTIIVFDRVRENRGRLAHVTHGIINDSINQTVSRTLMTSVTTFLAVLTLYTFGGDGVHGFAFAMMLGVMVGTYSSIAIAAPILAIGGGPKQSNDSDADDSLPATT